MLNISTLHVQYTTQRPILKGVNLIANEGQICGVLGMNGAGKTTLFKTIYGMLTAQTGSITFGGVPLGKEAIGYLETENYFYPFITGREYLQLLSPDLDINEQLNTIFALPLDNIIDSYSTGMKKRLAFWGLMLQNKTVIILDEPFNGVDIESVECFYLLIQKMKKAGKIILISSHIIESLTRICDKVAYLKDGQIQKEYTRHEFQELEQDIRNIIKEKMKHNISA